MYLESNHNKLTENANLLDQRSIMAWIIHVLKVRPNLQGINAVTNTDQNMRHTCAPYTDL